MALVMLEICYAPEAMERFMAQPEDRKSQVEALFESARCRLIGAWYVNGTNRAVFIVEGEAEDTRAVGVVALASKSVVACETRDLTAFSEAGAYFSRAQSIQKDFSARQSGSVPSFLNANG
ncbi:MAG: hypothetical protein EBZ03_07490 [Betaproteobacteria bacterium]|nr:hypothetical protein [Pseudomonadota bacterium]NBO12541.1 hypothetical protein [Betaproteobacteria bacterium]NBO44445.1 hypothetical protein [Betaproteobacteria bacterium]NBP10942.1 hypothetical protein [Betaproteobacteria bacterium]NBP61579.1 hypothetical protein [Betaproteobacteria bacterium]